MLKETFYAEDDFIQISALQHYVFCPRQCALIHVEDVWRENVYTVRGELLHEKVDSDTYETRASVRTVRGLRIHSYRFGLTGRCDVVEFRRTSANLEILPVEFKSGEPKQDMSDAIQLCAQVLCLEEMLNTTITRGAFFYGKIRRREYIQIDEPLRKQTQEIITAVRRIVSRAVVPTAQYMPKCRNCSIENICQPRAMNERKLKNYLSELYEPPSE
jgi:CRISPR-associated exonuclease Cas4